MTNPQMTGTASNAGQSRWVLGFCVLLTAVLSFLTLAPQASLNLLHLDYLKGLLGDEGALLRASQLAAAAPHPGSDAIYCQIELALGKEDRVRQTCAGLAPDAIPTVIHTVERLEKTQGSARALQLFEALSALYPDSGALYYHLSQVQPAGQPETVDSLRRALELAANPPALSTWELVDVHLRLAQNYLWWQAYALARDEAAAALALIPNPRAYRMQALAYAYLGEFDQADLSMQAAAATDASYWLYLDRGDVYSMQGKVDAAAADYRQFIALASETDALQGYLRLCRLYVAHQNSAALEPCQALIGYNGADASYRLLLGDALASVGEDEAAAEQYRRALTIDPQNADALDHLQKVEAHQ